MSTRVPSLTVRNLLNALIELVEWELLGARLGIKRYKLQAIDRNKRGDIQQCKLALLDQWLRSDTEASWEKLVQVLGEMGDDYNVMRENIKLKYIQGSTAARRIQYPDLGSMSKKKRPHSPDHPFSSPGYLRPRKVMRNLAYMETTSAQGPLQEVAGDVFEIDKAAVLLAIQDVTDWRSLGKHLGLESSKLDEIGRYSIEEHKSRMVGAWFASGQDCSWDKLYEALKKPAVAETRVAERDDTIRRASLTGYMQQDTVYKDSAEASSLTFSKNEDLVPFTESNVLDAITKIFNYNELGLILEIPPHKLSEIHEHSVPDKRQLFMSALFRFAPQENCNWKTVNSAIKRVQSSQWAAMRGSGSMTVGSSGGVCVLPCIVNMSTTGHSYKM